MEGFVHPGLLEPPRTREDRCGHRAAPHRSAPLRFDLATAADDAQLRRLLRDNPMGSAIQVAHEREPSFMDALEIEGDRHHVAVARDLDDRIVAMGVRSSREVYFNGRPARLGYLGQLRIEASSRSRHGLLADGYAFLGSHRDPDDLPFDLTSIMADNTAARRLLGAGVRGLPRYGAWERFVTLLVGAKGRGRPSRGIEAGSAQRLDEIVDCLQRNGRRHQLCPRWTAGDLLCPRRTRGLALEDFHLAVRDGRVIGCLARWDQRHFKQTVVRGCSPRVARWRPAFNLAATWLGLPRLPAVGERLDLVFLSHIAVDDDDPHVLADLIEAARGRPDAPAATCLVTGLAARHPMLEPLRRMFRHRAYESVLYLVDWAAHGHTSSPPDGRVPHVEVAIL